MIYLLSFSIPITTFISITYSQNLSWLTFIYAFIIVPIGDLIFKEGMGANKKSDSIFFDYLLYIFVPIQYLLLFYFCSVVATQNLSLLSLMGLIFSMGTCLAVASINIAHELGHRKSKLDIMLSKSLLITSLYYQFYIDHNQGHHKFVATPSDPSSANKGESLYRFWFRSIVGCMKSAFKIDKKNMLKGLGYELVLLVIVYLLFGKLGLLSFLAAALVGAIMLESVNYIEHYGLRRKLNPETNHFEKLTPAHSWNSNHLFSRAVLINLSRHSDHHYNINRKYQNLESIDDSPQMPTGYPGMILLALVPPAWFKIIDKNL